jgi:hypothetical protein
VIKVSTKLCDEKKENPFKDKKLVEKDIEIN